MSNPYVTIGNSIPEPSDPSTTRKTFTMKTFDKVPFGVYSATEPGGGYDPSVNGGPEFYMFYMLGVAINGAVGLQGPQFVTTDSWTTIEQSPSGFVTPNNSIMPKLIQPSKLMVDNGIDTLLGTYKAVWGPSFEDLFNWMLNAVNGFPVPANEWFKYWQVGAYFGSLYVSSKAKDDTSADNEIEIELDSPITPPTGDWYEANMVGGGAFVIMLNIVGTTPGQASPSDTETRKWSILMEFAGFTMELSDGSPLTVKIDGEDRVTTVNLAEGMAKEGPPQQQHMVDKPPLVIGVYPCWNGIVVVSGQQDTREVVQVASTFCPKIKGANIMDPAYTPSGWFDPANPDDVEVGVGTGPTSVLVDFGDKVVVTAKNCRFEIAYLPKFFAKKMKFDGWQLLNQDSADVTYTYEIWNIYSKNGTSYSLNSPVLTDSGVQGPQGQSYWQSTWEMTEDSDKYARWAAEIFAYILGTEEHAIYSIKNGNGSFDLTWSGGTPGDPSPGAWTAHIKQVSVTIGIDGSGGSIIVDKYGVAGQEAVANQCIGAITVEATGGENTVAGSIFQGLAMGVGDAEQTGDAAWTIPLIGLEKKLEDIALINPPYVDGEALSTVVDFLCRYAGLLYDMSYADGSAILQLSQETNVSLFDWKSGTSVKSALDDVVASVYHSYVVRDGKVYFYKLGTNGLPVSLGPDRSGGYDSTNMVTIDKTPDFEQLRNYIVGMALDQNQTGMGTDLDEIPKSPLWTIRETSTVPDVPWAKCLVRVFNSAIEPDELEDLVDSLAAITSIYEVTGKLTIPGNASIKPYDQWGDLVVASVTHNIDIQAKTWTTDLDFIRKST